MWRKSKNLIKESVLAKIEFHTAAAVVFGVKKYSDALACRIIIFIIF